MEITNSPTVHETPLLYNVNIDPSEKFNIAEEHPEVIAEIRKVLEEHLAGIEPVENQLEK
jgi:arylsulfatase A